LNPEQQQKSKIGHREMKSLTGKNSRTASTEPLSSGGIQRAKNDEEIEQPHDAQIRGRSEPNPGL
jgi:hypothetical protein